MKTLLLVLFIFSLPVPALGQFVFECANNKCLPPSGLTLDILDLASESHINIPFIDERIEIDTNNKAPHNFKLNFLSRTSKGIDLRINQSSFTPGAEGSSLLIIGDSIRDLNLNNSGFNGGIYQDASRICAERIISGDYGNLLKNNFNNRRSTNPNLPVDRCVSEDLQDIQNFGEVDCGPGKEEVLNQTIFASRWAKMRECHSRAGRAMCVAKRLTLRCEVFENRPVGTPHGQCCNNGVLPPSPTGWVCDPIGCNASDSGWKISYSFRMWESEYNQRALSGQSNEFICNELMGIAGSLKNELHLINKTMVALVENNNLSETMNIFPPAGANVASIEVSAGECGSYSDTPNSNLGSFSEWFKNNSSFIRMRGEGRKVICEDNLSLYPASHACYKIIESRNDSNLCFGELDQFPVGNQCYNELVPSCPDDRYETYDLNSYCRINKSTKCINRPYQNYDLTEAPFCHNLLKERQCGGVYTDWPSGSKCWRDNQPTCSGVYTDHPSGSYCRNKLSPTCSRFDIVPDGTPEWIHPLINDPDYNYCTSGTNTTDFPDVCNPVRPWSLYPVGSKCWTENQPNCPNPFDSYAQGSYCYEKNKPECLGNREDYVVGSFCYKRLTPENCTGDFKDYELGSFCFLELKSQINCTGNFEDYPFRSYCYEKLKPTCSDPISSYPIGSYCRRALQTMDSNGFFNCEGVYSDYPVGSYCFNELTSNCNGVYTDYSVGSFCYNLLYPGQEKEKTYEENCAINSGIGSLCWKSTLDDCESPLEDEDGAYFIPGTYCWYKSESETNGYCYGDYSDYPKGSDCWYKLRGVPELHYYSRDICSIRCQWNGSYASCNIGEPNHSIPHIETTSTFKGQTIPWDSILSFRVRFKIISEIGLERNVDNEVRIKVKNPNYPENLVVE